MRRFRKTRLHAAAATFAVLALGAATPAIALTIHPTAAVASSQYPGYDAGYAIDFGPNAAVTDWAAFSTGVGSYIDVALGGPFQLTGARVVDRVTSGGSNGGYVGGVFDYSTQISLQAISGLGGSVVGAAQIFSFGQPGGPSDFIHDLTFASPIAADFIRYQVLAANGSNPGLSNISFLTADPQAPAPVLGPNLLTNGSFEAGNTGFVSGYTFIDAPGPSAMYMPATYAIDVDPNAYHGAWASFGDHTSGAGAMMIVNGALNASALLWSQTVAVQVGRAYDFSAWIASTYTASPASVGVFINGVSIGNLLAGSTTGQWTAFSYGWNSGAATSATLQLFDLNEEWSGNDFALDDLRFSAVGVPEPSTWALTVIGFGLMGTMFRRRAAFSAAS